MQTHGLSLDEWLAQIETYSPQEIDLGLERVDALLRRLDLVLPETVLHVAGTNGKGSCVAMLDSLLRTTGARVGSYTSPHLLRYNERMRLGGVAATDAQIISAFERIESVRGDVPLVIAVVGLVRADHDEEHVGHLGRDALGDPNEGVEAAHGLEAAGHVGDDLDVVGDGLVADPPRDRSWLPQRGVDAVVDDGKPIANRLRELVALPLRGRVR